MTLFDTDVLTEILRGTHSFVQRAMSIPAVDQAVPIVVAEEILRGRLNAIRQAEANKPRLTIARAYELLRESMSDFRKLSILPFTDRAAALVQQWRTQKIHVGVRDLRIAAICVDHDATLASRNRRDFDRVPGLTVEYWT